MSVYDTNAPIGALVTGPSGRQDVAARSSASSVRSMLVRLCSVRSFTPVTRLLTPAKNEER